MATLNDMRSRMVKALKLRMDHATGVFKVATTSPFTVYLNGDETTAVPALKVAGLSYSVGTTGRYFLDQGQQPLCLPTV